MMMFSFCSKIFGKYASQLRLVVYKRQVTTITAKCNEVQVQVIEGVQQPPLNQRALAVRFLLANIKLNISSIFIIIIRRIQSTTKSTL